MFSAINTKILLAFRFKENVTNQQHVRLYLKIVLKLKINTIYPEKLSNSSNIFKNI